MEGILADFGQILLQNSFLALFLALIAGVFSSFSPCVLSALPLVIGYVGGYAGNDKKMALKYSFLFCFGLVLTFTLLGAMAAILGSYMLGAGKWWYLILGLIMALVSLQMFGIFDKSSNNCCKIPDKRKSLLGAFFIGILGGVLSSPCATPVLVAILAFVAQKGNILFGMLLLIFYAVGHCTLILLAGMSVSVVQKFAQNPKTQKIGQIVKIAFGFLILLLSLYLFYLGF